MKDAGQRLGFLAAAAAVLAACCLLAPPEDGAPFYTYHDEAGDLQLELYFDPETGQGQGTRYVRSGIEGQEAEPLAVSFTLDAAVTHEAWPLWETWRDPFSVRAFSGTDGSELVEDYQEFWEYDEGGRPVRFLSQGNTGGIYTQEMPDVLVRMEFFYREDGTLCRKSCWHNAYLFGTTGSPAEVFYDSGERPTFADCYITHGSMEFYYIYSGTAPEPDYCLYLDFFGGECYAELYPY